MKKILVTGASSFLGHHVLPLLKQYAVAVAPEMPSGGRGILLNPRFEILSPSSKELNLLDRDAVIRYLKVNKPDTILHMAALCGGIGANKKRPGEFILENTKMAINLFDAISEVNHWYDVGGKFRSIVTHFYGLGSVCGYPKHCAAPFKEDDIWNGYPEETNAPYGTAKRHLMVMQDAYRNQFGLKGAHLVPVNMYGEHDHFDLENSHVIPALINKFIEAKNDDSSSVDVWGDGTPTREFLYAGDCAKAIVKAVTTQLDYNKPINLGTGHDISIKDLAYLIRDIVGFNGDIKFTGEVSVNGQPKRRLDVSRAKDVLDFTAETGLRTGLKKTIAWYNGSRFTPIKEVMIDEDKLSKRRAEALARLNRIVVLLEKNIEELFEQIQSSPDSAKTDCLFQKYLELLSVSLDRVKSIRNDSIESPILKNPGASFYVKADSQVQRLVKEIRNSIGDAALLNQLAERVDSIKPDLNSVTEENKEFLISLIKRIQRAQPEDGKIKRAYEIANQMVAKGMIDGSQIERQVGEIMTWNDANLESFKIILERQPITKKPEKPEVTNLKKVPLSALYSCIGIDYDNWKASQNFSAINKEIAKREKEKVDSLVMNGDAIRRHLRDVNTADKLIKQEEVKLAAQIEEAKKRLDELEDRRNKFFKNMKEVNYKTGEVKVLDYTSVDFLNQNFPLSSLKLPKKEDLTKKVDESNDHLSGVGGYPSEVSSKAIGYEYSKSEELKKHNIAHGHKGKANPVDLLVRAGLSRDVAEQRIRESLGSEPSAQDTLKALGINPFPKSSSEQQKKIDELADNVKQKHLAEMAKEITSADDEKPKYNKVRRIDDSGMDVEITKKPTIQEAAKAVGQAEESLKNANTDLSNLTSFSPISNPKIDKGTIVEYETRDKFKYEKAQSAVVDGGPGSFRRGGGNPKDSKRKCVKTSVEHESDFMKAIDAFEKEYGVPVFDCKVNKRGKRISGEFNKSLQSVSDVEIMTASILKPTVKLESFKLDTNAIACPKRAEEKKVDSGTVSQPKAERINPTPNKVEKKERVTLISTAKKFISNLWFKK